MSIKKKKREEIIFPPVEFFFMLAFWLFVILFPLAILLGAGSVTLWDLFGLGY